MSYIYLASPYTTKDKFLRAYRYRAACKATADLMRAGEVVFCPVAYGHSLEVRLEEEFPHDYWITWSKAMLAAASKLYVLTLAGWNESKGISAEVGLAYELNIPVLGYHTADCAEEEVSGYDILGHFGFVVKRRKNRVVPTLTRAPSDD